MALPLDDVSGATAGYGLRKLRAAYAGSCIRVRTTGGSEQDVGFSGDDLDVAGLESFCSGTDCFIVKWYDQSGTGGWAEQATDGQRPQIVSGGAVITNTIGKPSMYFDGVDDSLFVMSSAPAALPVSSWVAASAYTTFAVAKLVTIPSTSTAYFGSAIWSENGGYVGLMNYNTTYVANYSYDTDIDTADVLVSLNTDYVFEGRHESGSVYFKATGISEDSDLADDTDLLSGVLAIGYGYYSPAYNEQYISEILVYNTALSSGDRSTLNSNLEAYWITGGSALIVMGVTGPSEVMGVASYASVMGVTA